MWDFLFDTVAEWALHWAPRPVRIGCTILLCIVVAALLCGALYLWAFK